MINTITCERCNYFLACGMILNRQVVPLLTDNKKTAKIELIDGNVSKNKKISSILHLI